jgi:hypothetical protein
VEAPHESRRQILGRLLHGERPASEPLALAESQ